MKISLRRKIWGRVKTQVRDAATGRIKRESGWQDNLVLDNCLNTFANGNFGFATCCQAVKIGSGNNPTEVSGGATFTQVGTQITVAPPGWFTTNNVTPGSLIKYGAGSAGAEQYIASIDGTGTIATVTGAGMAVAVPTVGTVYFVQQTALQTPLYDSDTYDPSGGANSTVFSANQAVMQRTVVFPVQVAPYTVNEIGYHDVPGVGGNVYGRIVLGAGDVVSPTEFYVVVIQMTFTVTPAAPTAVGNVGTNFDTSGQIAWNYWSCQKVNNAGGGTVTENGALMDEARSAVVYVLNDPAALPLNASPADAGAPQLTTDYYLLTGIAVPSNAGQPVGVGVSNGNNFAVTTAGETCNAIVLGYHDSGNDYAVLVLNLTTPQVLPAGPFSGNVSWVWTFGRELVN